jgi:hypothetical protein
VRDFLPGIARPAFERYGFATVEILSNWRLYAGADFAGCTAPEKLTWPRAGAGGETGSGGGTLLLRVSGARAIEVQHKLPLLMERINAAFGYRALAAIRLLQAPLPEKARTARRGTQAGGLNTCDADALAQVPDPRLRSALRRISAGIAARRDIAVERAKRT